MVDKVEQEPNRDTISPSIGGWRKPWERVVDKPAPVGELPDLPEGAWRQYVG